MTNKIEPAQVSEQNDELQALESIYPNEFSIIDYEKRCFKISVASEGPRKHTVELKFTFIPGYPSESPPIYEISAPTLQKTQRSNLLHALNEVCAVSLGSAMIFSMVETIKSFIEEQEEESSQHCEAISELDESSIGEPMRGVVKSTYVVPSVRDHLLACGRRLPIAEGVSCPNIYHGNIITDRKSVFQAHCCEVSSLPEISAFISTMLEDRKVAAATHNITAWYLRTKLKADAPTTSLVADYDDDGETQAGSRLLHLISLAAKEGVAVMVTRWYGGIQLGPDRFKHINNAASQLLAQVNLTKNSNPETVQPKSKGSGKKKP
ncbi:unnamed protein product [Rodentolepis nana]|uniref:RWD domain-containing protein n=1 Tax=Rodentolepis nana TaxID=102285 RepID=A0A0R3T4N1_RODNA|nr:unnamed protein product [Rodentolepis nana]